MLIISLTHVENCPCLEYEFWREYGRSWVVPTRLRRPIDPGAVRRLLGQVQAAVESQIQQTMAGCKCKENLDYALFKLARAVLPRREFVNLLSPGADLVLRVKSEADIVAEIPWEMMPLHHRTCPHCRESFPANFWRTFRRRCPFCGKDPVVWLTGVCRVSRTIDTREEIGPTGHKFLVIIDPTGDLTAKKADPTRGCKHHQELFCRHLKTMGYEPWVLCGPDADVKAVETALQDPDMAGVYCFLHARHDEANHAWLELADDLGSRTLKPGQDQGDAPALPYARTPQFLQDSRDAFADEVVGTPAIEDKRGYAYDQVHRIAFPVTVLPMDWCGGGRRPPRKGVHLQKGGIQMVCWLPEAQRYATIPVEMLDLHGSEHDYTVGPCSVDHAPEFWNQWALVHPQVVGGVGNGALYIVDAIRQAAGKRRPIMTRLLRTAVAGIVLLMVAAIGSGPADRYPALPGRGPLDVGEVVGPTTSPTVPVATDHGVPASDPGNYRLGGGNDPTQTILPGKDRQPAGTGALDLGANVSGPPGMSSPSNSPQPQYRTDAQTHAQ